MENYQVMPPLTADEYNELKADIANRGVMVPIEYDEHGNVLDGHHRIQICAELGIMDFPKVIRTGMTEVEKRTHARKLNMARRQLNQEQRRELIREQLRETPEISDRQIARELGVDKNTVNARRVEMESGGEIHHLDTTVGADGKQYPRQVEHRPFDLPPAATMWEAESQERARAVLDIPSEPIEYEHRPHVTNNSGCNEWYTPERYIDLAREVLGEIDLDPASCEFANETVKAKIFYSEENDGLCKMWNGRVWMNPPYSSELVPKFTEKFVDEYNDGNITEGIVLVNNATETAWFTNMVNAASAVCFPRGRIRYQSQTRESLAPLQGQAFLYFGENKEKFLEVFSEIGWGAVIYV